MRSAEKFRSFAAAILLPLLATIFIVTGDIILGAAMTLILGLMATLAKSRSAVKTQGTERYALGIDAILFLLVAIVSAVVIGTIFSPGDSKLFRLRYSGFAGEADIAPSYLVIVWCLSLCTLPTISAIKTEATKSSRELDTRTLAVLGILGFGGLVLSLTVSRYDVFSSRGETGGNGLNSLLYWSAAVFVSYVSLMQRRNNAKFNLIAAGLMTLGLLASGNRSPIALIGVALLVRVIMDRRQKLMMLLVAVIPAGLAVFSYQSIWRSLVSRGLPSGSGDVLAVMSSNPLQEFLRLGLDTVDGHALVVRLIDEGFSPQWMDPMLAVANFIPRQLWEDKPILLGSTIGHDYLGLTAGGIFLSGPGYFSLVSGSVFWGSAFFILFILCVKRLVSMPGTHPVIVCAAFYLVARISIAGDAFDIFLSVQIAAILGVSTLIGKAIPWQES